MTRTVVLALALLASLAAAPQSKSRKAVPSTAEKRTWTRVTGPKDSAANEVTLARTSDGALHLAWLRPMGGTAEIVHTVVVPGGVPRETGAIVTGWKSLAVPALVRDRDGGLRLLFGGVLGTTSGSDPYNAGSLYTATAPADGTRWTLAAGQQSASTTAYIGPIAAAVDGTGAVASAWAASSALNAQSGFGSGKRPDRFEQGCCPYQPGLGVDGANGEVVLAWYSNADANLGVNARVIAPQAKEPIRVPGTVVSFGGRPNSSSIDQRVPVSGRIGAAGIYLAYCAGYPTFTSVNLWRFGDARPIALAKLAGGRSASVTAAPDGRLWVMWATNRAIAAVRSNRAASRFSRAIPVAAPPGTTTVYRLTGEGTTGPLDLLAHVSTAAAGAATWHTRVFPLLDVTASPGTVSALQGGTVTVSVTDVGDPVAGARLTIGTTTLTTGADGRASYQVAKGAKPEAIRVVASADGYTVANATIAVK